MTGGPAGAPPPAGVKARPPVRLGTTLLRAGLLFLIVNAAYLAALDSATIFYHAQVVAHVVAGLLVLLLAAVRGPAALRRMRARTAPGAARAWLALMLAASAGCAITALLLAYTGTATPYRPWLVAHVVAAAAAFSCGVGWLAGRGRGLGARRLVAFLVIAAAFPLLVRGYDWLRPAHVSTIENPAVPPLTMDQEGGGPQGPFFPSSVETVGGRLIPPDFFLESKACGNRGCHPDITAQWTSSMHHFSSFNNQWYRKSIEYMQEVVGTRPSKWCGGCHDQAVILTGRMDRPVVEQIDTPQAQAGIGCLVCHSIVHVKDTMGQGGYVLEYPEMHRLVASHNPVLHLLHDYMTRLDPGPHKATMLKPFHRTARAEFCSACHKVHLDVPVNHYRWIRGFNEYDAWQGSAVSGQGARSFYYPKQPKDCADCHMPLVRSTDQGNREGFVHSHRFPAANTAVPFVNRDDEQLEAVRQFLTAGILTVDIFAASEAGPEGKAQTGRRVVASSPDDDSPRAATLVPEMPDSAPPSLARRSAAAGARGGEILPPIAPLDRAAAFLRPGRAYRVDVVARTRTIGHFFPGGTVDAFDVWLELKAEDADGRVIYWSGFVEDGGAGPVEAGAHRYRSLMVDAHGNEINKRNAWAARAVVYARLIPPGAADVGRYRVTIPEDARSPITLTARMNYRKFTWYNTRFSFAGVPGPAASKNAVSADFDDRSFLFDGDTSRVSGAVKTIPDLPITVIAEDRLSLPLLEAGRRADRAGGRATGRAAGRGAAGGVDGAPAPQAPEPLPADRERWNDYGIGLLLQGDLVGAKAAFERVVALEPSYAPGFVNLGRVLVQEGEHAAAIKTLERALAIDPNLAGAHYFMALALKSRGRYDDALAHLRSASTAYPQDKVVRNQIGRLRFLQRRYREAIDEFETSLRVDPEDLTAHYNLMLCYRALGEREAERREEILYSRFKADESARAIPGPYRRLNPQDNLERQPIHEHANRYAAGDAGGPGTGGQ